MKSAKKMPSVSEGPSGNFVEITSHSPRRRAGYVFGPEPLIINVEDLDDAKQLALTNDPQLVIRPHVPEAKSGGEPDGE